MNETITIDVNDLERPVSAAGVRAAAERIKGVAYKTPLLEHETLNERVGGRIFLKADNLQRFGSFKIRGAYNLMSQLSAEQHARGVLAWSSGNHAQAVAYSAKLLNAPATILMPEDAPAIKRANVVSLGAEVITYDRYSQDREAIGRARAEKDGLFIVPPYDHPAIIEGQGTLALEAARQAAEIGVKFDTFAVCCGGGGLAAGSATIFAEIAPDCRIFIAEPEFFDESWASVRDGERRFADPSRTTICDALAAPTPGALTLPILQAHIKGGLSVSEDEIADAMRFAFQTLKLVIEPGGAAALAAILAGKLDVGGKNTCLTLSGGNVDFEKFITIAQ